MDCEVVLGFLGTPQRPPYYSDSLDYLLLCGAVSKSWRDVVSGLGCWRPAIPPPSWANLPPVLEPLPLHSAWRRWCTEREHLIALAGESSDDSDDETVDDRERQRRVQAARTRRQNARKRLSAPGSAWDGWCALAPYMQPGGAVSSLWMEPLTAGRRPEPRRSGRGKRTPSGAPKRAQHPNQLPSVYFQNRKRQAAEAFRLFYSVAVHEFVDETLCCGCQVHNELHVQVVHITGDERLASHEHDLSWLEHLSMLLSCCGWRIRLTETELELCSAEVALHVRRCPVTSHWQLDAGLVERRLGAQSTPNPTVYYIAPHMYKGRDLAWIFSIGIRNSTEQYCSAVMSSFMLKEEFSEDSMFARNRLALAFAMTLSCLAQLDGCENTPCVNNGVDGVDELASRPLLLCPGCLRKLQVLNVLSSVPQSLEKLRHALLAIGTSSVVDLQPEVDKLTEWLDGIRALDT